MLFPQDQYCIVDNKPCSGDQLYCSVTCKMQDTQSNLQLKNLVDPKRPLKSRLITSSTIIRRNNNPSTKVYDAGDEYEDEDNFNSNDREIDNDNDDLLEDSVFSIDNVNTHTYPLPLVSRSASLSKSRARSIISNLLVPPSLVSDCDTNWGCNEDNDSVYLVDDDLNDEKNFIREDILVQWNYDTDNDNENNSNNNHWLYDVPTTNNEQKDCELGYYDLSPVSKSNLKVKPLSCSSSPTSKPVSPTTSIPLDFKTIQNIMFDSDSKLKSRLHSQNNDIFVSTNYNMWLD